MALQRYPQSAFCNHMYRTALLFSITRCLRHTSGAVSASSSNSFPLNLTNTFFPYQSSDTLPGCWILLHHTPPRPQCQWWSLLLQSNRWGSWILIVGSAHLFTTISTCTHLYGPPLFLHQEYEGIQVYAALLLGKCWWVMIVNCFTHVYLKEFLPYCLITSLLKLL